MWPGGHPINANQRKKRSREGRGRNRNRLEKSVRREREESWQNGHSKVGPWEKGMLEAWREVGI